MHNALMIICSLVWSYLLHTVDNFVKHGCFNFDQVIISMCFVCLLAKQHTHTALSEKTQFPCFLFLQKHKTLMIKEVCSWPTPCLPPFHPTKVAAKNTFL